MLDSLPVSTGTIGIILLMISFLNQAFLGLQIFQVQGRNQALMVIAACHLPEGDHWLHKWKRARKAPDLANTVVARPFRSE